jgi:prepilin peptidase CpaA
MLQGWVVPIGHFLVGATSVVLCMAALHDVLARTVPNWMPIMLAGLGVAKSALDDRLIMSLVIGALMFILSGLCWRRGWLGGGDVKLLAAASVVVPPLAVPPFVAAVALAGGVLALIYLALCRFIPRSVLRRSTGRPNGLLPRALRLERWRLSRRGPLPYAIAIAAGGLLVLL